MAILFIYGVNLILYGLFIGLIFGMKINTKKRLPVCIGIGVGSILIQIIFEIIIGCLAYIFYDEAVIVSTLLIIEEIIFTSIPVLTLWIISLVAGCSKKNKKVLISCILVFVLTIILQIIYVRLNLHLMDANLIPDNYLNDVYEVVKTQEQMGAILKMRRVFERVPALIYGTYVIVKCKSNK